MLKRRTWESQESHNMVLDSTQAGKQMKAEDCAFASFLCNDIFIFKNMYRSFTARM